MRCSAVMVGEAALSVLIAALNSSCLDILWVPPIQLSNLVVPIVPVRPLRHQAWGA